MFSFWRNSTIEASDSGTKAERMRVEAQSWKWKLSENLYMENGDSLNPWSLAGPFSLLWTWLSGQKLKDSSLENLSSPRQKCYRFWHFKVSCKWAVTLQRWLLVNHPCPVHAELLIGILVSPSEYEWTAKKIIPLTWKIKTQINRKKRNLMKA